MEEVNGGVAELMRSSIRDRRRRGRWTWQWVYFSISWIEEPDLCFRCLYSHIQDFSCKFGMTFALDFYSFSAEYLFFNDDSLLVEPKLKIEILLEEFDIICYY